MATSAADKLIQALLSFQRQPQWMLTDLAEYLAFPKSTVHRLLTQLKDYGLVEQDNDSNEYRLGLEAWRLGQSARPHETTRRAAASILTAVVHQTRETAFLTVVEGMDGLCVGRVEGTHGLRFSLEVGSTSPLHLGASNLILLAYLPRAMRQEVAAYWLPDHGVRDALLARLEHIRAKGYVHTTAELTAGISALAVPVLDQEGGALAGLSVGGPAERFTKASALAVLPDLREASEEIARRLAISGDRTSSENSNPRRKA